MTTKKTMTNSLMRWHLARDNCLKLAKFCEKNAVRHENITNAFQDEEHTYFHHTYYFDNGGHIKAEMLQGDTRGYSMADYFAVIDYGWGTK